MHIEEQRNHALHMQEHAFIWISSLWKKDLTVGSKHEKASNII
jgi:hypothetical protein